MAANELQEAAPHQETTRIACLAAFRDKPEYLENPSTHKKCFLKKVRMRVRTVQFTRNLVLLR
jgi:hypothetical protein